MSAPTVFISYRRGPDENAAGRLYEALDDKLGPDRVFMDVDGIRPGIDFVDDLDQKLDSCAAFLAVIGPNWIERQDELHNPDDFVRQEYAAVLARKDIPFIPIFFHNAQMPDASTLPDDLKGLVRRNGLTMPHEHFTSVLNGRLLPELSAILGEDLTGVGGAAAKHGGSRRSLLKWGGVAAAVLAGAGGLALSGGVPSGVAGLFTSSVVGKPFLETGSVLSNFSRIDFSPDSQILASGDSNLAAKLWDIETGAVIAQLQGHTGRIEAVVFSDDGQYLATVGQDNMARVWDVADQSEIAVLSGHSDWVYSADFSSDGARLVTASADNTARIWDWRTGEVLQTFTGHQNEVEMAIFAPDDQTLATASTDGTAKIWSLATGDMIIDITDHLGPVYAVAFSPDGSLLATASEDTSASLWDTFSGSEMMFFEAHDDAVTGIVFSADGMRVATSSTDGTSRMWDAGTGEEIGAYRRNEAEFYTVALSDDGTRFATATHTHLVVAEVE